MINLILNTRSFTETLLYDVVLITSILLLVYIYGFVRGAKNRIAVDRGGKKQDKVWSRLVVILALSILVLGILPLDSIARTPLYFIVQGVSAGLVLLLFATGRLGMAYVIFYTVVSLLSVPALVYLKNLFYPRYNVAQEALYVESSIRSYMDWATKRGYYYFIPVDPLLIVLIAYVCGEDVSYVVPVIRHSIIYLSIFLSIFALIKRLGVRAFYATILAYAITPTLSFLDRILSLPYSTTLIYILALTSSSNRLGRKLALLMTPIALVMVFAHPVGPLAILAFLASTLVLSWIFRKNCIECGRLYSVSKDFLLLTAIIAFGYWFTTHIYTLLLAKATRTVEAFINFVNSILGRGEVSELILGYTITEYTAPGYSNPKFFTYAYVWALPIAVALTLLIISLIGIFHKRGPPKTDAITVLGMASALSAIIFIGGAYIGYVMNIEPGQYMIPAGYYIATLTLGIALHGYLRLNPSKAVLISIVVLLALGVGLGLHSPNWAPLEHPDFESSIMIHPYINYIEADLIIDYVDKYVTIYSVYDFPLGARGKMPNYILDQIRLGNTAKYGGILIGVRSDEPILMEYPQYINVLYSTGSHILIQICR